MRSLVFIILFFVSIDTGIAVTHEEISFSGHNLQPDAIISSSSNIENITPSLCSVLYTMSGPDGIRMNTVAEYTLANTLQLPSPEVVEYQILSQSGEVLKTYQDRLVHLFTDPGLYSVRATNLSGSVVCSGSIQKEISVYRNVIVYIGNDTAGIDDTEMASVFRTKSTYLSTFPVSGSDFQIESEGIWNAIADADTIIFEYADILELFTSMERMQRLREINFSEKKLYVISPYSRAFLSKVLASSLAKMGIQDVALISRDQLNTLLWHWSFGDNPKTTLGETLSYEKSGFIFTLGTFLEFLAYSGVSYQMLGFLLSIACAALVYNFLKQIIGVYVFGMYYPLIFAVLLVLM